ncbi:MAG TPA: AAA family ATPase [Candidatus Saccharimonadales bacterium]
MREDVLNAMAEAHFMARPNLDLVRNDMIVLYMAPPGSGKSTLRQAIVAATGATYICNDEIRDIIAQHPEAAGHGITIGDVGLRVWEMITTRSRNHLIVFDNTISKYYMNEDSYLNTGRRQGYRVYIVQIDIPKTVLTERIRSRHDRPETARLLDELDDNLAIEAAARKNVQADYVFGHDGHVDALIADIRAAYRAIGTLV